ncbi:MAG: hypothetical protein K2G29_02725, partial [Muribaculaceae bacterium]|nr:hypothetical protein [Muribaculaceae bacterium]
MQIPHLFAAAAIAVASPCVYAVEPYTQAQLDSITQAQLDSIADVFQLDQVVVTGSKSEVTRRKSPSLINVMSGKLLTTV